MTDSLGITTDETAPRVYVQAMDSLRLLLLADPACDRCSSLEDVVLCGEVDLLPGATMTTWRLCPACRATLVVGGGGVS